MLLGYTSHHYSTQQRGSRSENPIPFILNCGCCLSVIMLQPFKKDSPQAIAKRWYLPLYKIQICVISTLFQENMYDPWCHGEILRYPQS